MDTRNEEKHVFNIRLAKLVGLYQMLDPGTVTFLGRNVYQMFAALLLTYELVLTAILFVGSLRLWTYNTGTSLLDFLLTSNCFYSCYKMSIIIYRSHDLWDCLSITRYDFTSLSRNRKRNGHDILDLWRSRVVRYTSILAVMYILSMVSYVASPLAFGGAVISIKNHDGSIGNYRLNVLNLYFFITVETYNEYYYTFYIIEALFILTTSTFHLIVDTLVMTLCFAICCQMQVICSAFESVHHNSPSDSHSPAIDNTDEKQIISNEHDLTYDELITNIINHQAVIKKYESFLTIFERATLSQIFASSLSIIVLWFNLIMSFFNDGTFAISGDATMKTIVAIPSSTFQILMTCYLFEIVHNQVIGNCYSVISVLINYMKAKSG